MLNIEWSLQWINKLRVYMIVIRCTLYMSISKTVHKYNKERSVHIPQGFMYAELYRTIGCYHV